MIRQELKRILSDKLLWIGIGVMLLLLLISFYGDAFADPDGNNYYDEDHSELIHMTQQEKILAQKEACAPYIGEVLNDAMIDEFLTLWSHTQTHDSMFLYEETPMYAICNVLFRYSYRYTEERAASLGDTYRPAKITDEDMLVMTTEQLAEQVGVDGPIVIQNGYGYVKLMESLQAVYVAGLFVVALVIVRVFSSDHRYHTSDIILVSQYGRSRDVSARILAALMVAVLLFLLVTLLAFVLYLSVYGISGISAPLFMTSLAFIDPSNDLQLTVGMVLLRVLAVGCAVYLSVSAFALVVSAFFRSEYVGAVLLAVLLCLPWLIGELILINDVGINSFLNVVPIPIFFLHPENNGMIWYCTETSAGISYGALLCGIYLVVCLLSVLTVKIRMRRMYL